MNRAWRLGGIMAGYAAGKRELAHQPAHPYGILRHARIDLRVAALQPGVRQSRRTAVTGAYHDHHVQVPEGDRAAQVCPDEVDAWRGAPVPQQTGLDVFRTQRLGEQGVLHQVDLACRQVVGGPPVGVDRGEVFWWERGRGCHVGASCPVGIGTASGGWRLTGQVRLTTVTGHDAWCTQCVLTEPSIMPVKPPCPLLPTTSRSAFLDSSISACAGCP